jgi:hypothetical protein
MGVPTPPSGLSQPTNSWWWVPGGIVIVAGLAMVALGIYDHDNNTLITLGGSVMTAATGFLIGKQSPTP